MYQNKKIYKNLTMLYNRFLSTTYISTILGISLWENCQKFWANIVIFVIKPF